MQAYIYTDGTIKVDGSPKEIDELIALRQKRKKGTIEEIASNETIFNTQIQNQILKDTIAPKRQAGNAVRDGFPSVQEFFAIIKQNPNLAHSDIRTITQAMGKTLPPGSDPAWTRVYMRLRRAKRLYNQS